MTNHEKSKRAKKVNRRKKYITHKNRTKGHKKSVKKEKSVDTVEIYNELKKRYKTKKSNKFISFVKNIFKSQTSGS